MGHPVCVVLVGVGFSVHEFAPGLLPLYCGLTVLNMGLGKCN